MKILMVIVLKKLTRIRIIVNKKAQIMKIIQKIQTIIIIQLIYQMKIIVVIIQKIISMMKIFKLILIMKAHLKQMKILSKLLIILI